MAPILTPRSVLAPRYYYYYPNNDAYYKGRLAGIVVGCVIFLAILGWYIWYRRRCNKRPSTSPLLYGPGGALSTTGIAPPPYSGPAEQAPTWNGTQWQGPNNLDGSPGPCWNGIEWCRKPGPVWNGRMWVNAGRINGVVVPMNARTRKVWNGKEWIGGWPAEGAGAPLGGNGGPPGGGENVAVGQESGVVDWHKRDLEIAQPAAPAPVYVADSERRDSLRRDGVNADGGLGHAGTQSRDFGAAKGDATATATSAPEVKEEKASGFKKWFK